jgi:hypothetical protein
MALFYRNNERFVKNTFRMLSVGYDALLVER